MVETTSNFEQIRISLASPEEIKCWSHGEVKKPETINYRTFKPEPEGLFCERIFGPTKDWECHCGKYRKIKFRGVVCDRCGVEVIRSKVRRERMGHIDLSTPVSHIWYLKNVPSPMSLLLNISPRPLEKILYFVSYVVTKINVDLLSQHSSAIIAAVDERKHDLDIHFDELAEIIEDEYREKLEEEGLSNAEKNKIISQKNDRIKYERKLMSERKDEMDSALRLIMGPELDMAMPITQKQLLTDDEHRALVHFAEEVDMFLCIRNGETNDDLLDLDRELELRGATSGATIFLRNNLSEPLLISQTGADAIRTLLSEVDLEEESRRLRTIVKDTVGPKRMRAVKELEVVESFRKSKNRPEWMILNVIPVIPPELRPMVQLDGGRFATSDLNDLYRRIINRNNRLKKIKELHAPESIINHEKRLLQEAVDALIDNGRRSRPVTGSNQRALKSLSDMLKGKDGRFRKNLLGKRVDYSGRSVIVVGPYLKLNQCGLPKEMALELFKPFVMKRLVQKKLASNVKTAKKQVERLNPEVWDALEEVIKDHPVLLNRAPTLHRLGIQAFEPVLVDGKAIQLHPLVCTAFNADFDGDQMAVHVPLSTAAQTEARVLMMSTENLFSPANGKPVMIPTRDMVLGAYYLTIMTDKEGLNGAGTSYGSAENVIMSYETGLLDMHAEINVRFKGKMIKSTAGRIILNQILPEKLQYYGKVVDSSEIGNITRACYDIYGLNRTVQLLDDLKELGFKYSTISGTTIAMTDMDVPSNERENILTKTEKSVSDINEQFANGLISEGERSQKVCEAWIVAANDVANALLGSLDQFNPLLMMSNSGARGSKRQLSQLAGMRGLMTDPFGRFIEDLPIKSNFHEGLNVLEYFVSTHGARKGLADTALRTADAGYLTRRMVDVAQEVIVRGEDCGTMNGIEVFAIRDRQEEIEPLDKRIDGRIAAVDIIDPFTGKVILRRNQEIGHHSLPACTKDGGELLRSYRCNDCGRIISESEYKDSLYQLATTDVSVSQDLSVDEIAVEKLIGAIENLGVESSDDIIQPMLEEDESAEEIQIIAEIDEESDELSEDAADFDALVIEESIETECCPDCGGLLTEIAVCNDCGEIFEVGELESPLRTIKRIVDKVEAFYADVRRVRGGGTLFDDIIDPFTGDVVAHAGKKTNEGERKSMSDIYNRLHELGGLATGKVMIRSSLTCELRHGICAKCYGRDMATGRQVEAGEAVGIIAAQSIGEPGTQLTMRTFHTGGVAGQYLTGVANVKDQRIKTLTQILEDVNRGHVKFGETNEREKVKQIQKMVKVMEQQVSGLLRVVELFEARKPKGQAIITDYDGIVTKIDTTGGGRTVYINSDQLIIHEDLIIGKTLGMDVRAEGSNKVCAKAGEEITTQLIVKMHQAGVKSVVIEYKYMVPYRGTLRVAVEDMLKAGNPLTEGPLDPQELLRMRGPREVQEYLVQEIQRVYRSQSVDINDKHVETIVRQMLRRRKITEPGDTDFLPGQVIDRFDFQEENDRIVALGGTPATADWVLLGITEASLATDSFLSAASFQKTTRVLTEAAIKGKVDNLVGLKENVIIGRLIPAGTGMDVYRNVRIMSPSGEINNKSEQTPHEQDFIERLIDTSSEISLESLSDDMSDTDTADLSSLEINVDDLISIPISNDDELFDDILEEIDADDEAADEVINEAMGEYVLDDEGMESIDDIEDITEDFSSED